MQVGHFPCEADGLTLYLLVPAALDILFNLESETSAVVTTPHWQMEGEARVCSLAEGPLTLRLARSAQAAGCMLVAVCPGRLHFSRSEGWGYQETIDL
jgi:hypothetical protein